MMTQRIVLFVLIAASFCAAQAVRVSGVVLDSATRMALKGAQVCLLKKAMYDTSDASGAFVLSDVSVIREAHKSVSATPSVGKNGLLNVALDKNEHVAIQVYAINGKMISSVSGQWRAGSYAVPSPVKAPGIYVYRISIGEAVYSLKFIASAKGSVQSGIGYRKLETTSMGNTVFAKRSASKVATDTVMATMDGYYPAKTPVASITSDMQVLMRKVSLKNGVKPGVLAGSTSQGNSFAISIGRSGKIIDSLVFTVSMYDCPQAVYTFTLSIPGPITIPENGVVTLGDSVKLVFLDSTVSGSFYTNQVVQLTTSTACYTSTLTIIGSGYIIQEIPYYNHSFRLYVPVNFSNSLFALTVNSTHGKVMKTPDKAFYFPGETVDLQASADSVSHFTGWNGDVSSVSNYSAQVIMNANKTVTANFAANYLLTLKTTNGTMLKYPDLPTYPPGDTVMLTAIPSVEGYCFSGWTGDTVRTSKNVTWIVMDSSKTISAGFTPAYNLSLTANNGTIRKYPDNTCYIFGTRDTVMLVAEPDSGYKFYSWQGNVVRKSKDTAWVVMDSSRTISATFVDRNVSMVFKDTVAVYAVAISPDGSKVLTGCRDGTAKLWDAATGSLLRTLSDGMVIVYSVAFSPDGSRMLTGDWAGNAKLWDAYTLVRTFPNGSLIYSAAMSADGQKIIAGGLDDTVRVWDANTGALVRKFGGHSSIVTSVAFAPNGTQALSGSWDQTAQLWDINTGLVSKTFTGHSGIVYSAVVSPDGSKILTGSADMTAKIWGANTGLTLQTLNGHRSWVVSVAFSPDGSKALTGAYDQTAKLWETSTGALIQTFTHSGRVTSVAFSANGTKVLTGSEDGTAVLWDISNVKSLAKKRSKK